MRRATNSQPIATVVKGYAGESPGAATCEIDVKNVIPAVGFERDFGPVIASLTQVELGLLGPGGKTAKVKGYVVEDSVEHSVDNPSAYNFKWRGPIPQFT